VCRHLAYVADEPITLDTLVLRAPHSLLQQARAPRFQASGNRNPDGFGVGWYDDRGIPHRYRTATPIWADSDFATRAASIRSRVVLAAVRLASPGAPVEETGNAPFVSDRWLFSLNGFVRDFHAGTGHQLRSRLTPARAAALEGVTDSEVVFGLVLDQLDAGWPAPDALRRAVKTVESVAGGRLNLLLTDGEAVYATAWGNSLFVRAGTIVASEPLDDAPDWEPVPDRSLVELGEGRSSDGHRTTTVRDL
jgi:glutamine amidotransferase